MAGGELAKYWVEFGAKGVEGIDRAVDGVGERLKKADAEAAPLAKGIGRRIGEGIAGAVANPLAGLAGLVARPVAGLAGVLAAPLKLAGGAVAGLTAGLTGPLAAALSKVGEQLKAVGQAAQGAFATARNFVMGFVRAGLQGTTMGERFALSQQLLAREVASLFLPVMERVIGVVQRVTDWFRSLSGAQQEAAGKAIAFGLAALGVAAVLPRIVGGLQGVGAAFSLLAANPFAAALAGVALLLTATQEGREAVAGIAGAFGPVLTALGAVGRALAPIIEAIGSILPPLVQALTPVFEGVAFVVTKIADGITAVIEVLKAGINWVIDRINDVRRFFGADEIARIGEGRQRAARPGQGRHELANAGRGPEALQASFLRFQTAALRTSTIPEQQLREQRITNEILRRAAELQGQPVPAPVS